MPTERELKYSLLDDHVPSEPELRAAYEPRGVAVGPLTVVRHTDRYYDDARLSLSRAGVALRRRLGGGEVVATLKAGGAAEGAYHAREEIELPFEGRDWPGPIRERIERHTDPGALQPVLSIETERVRVPLSRDGTPLALLSFDRVAARLPGSTRTVHFDELEIEAHPDTPDEGAAPLEALAEPLDGMLTLTASSSSKLERARALLMAF